MNKDELRIRIIPEYGQLLIETHTNGIVKCKEVQEDALLDCIKNSTRWNYVNSGLLPSDCIHVKIHPNGNKEYCLCTPRYNPPCTTMRPPNPTLRSQGV